MALQNRVAPDGSIHAVSARGMLMGNRGGRLHDAARRLGSRRWASRRWITCLTSFKGRRRAVMGNGYTELFFLDEATALAAGHRPCFECRRGDAVTLIECLHRPNERGPRGAGELDAALHRERLGPRPVLTVADLPDGAMFAADGAVWLVWAGRALRWSFAGYTSANDLPSGARPVLTPISLIGAMKSGYRPKVHASAEQWR